MPDPGAETVVAPATGVPGRPGTKAPQGPLDAGAPFGVRYRILRELGAGGMGVVYQAWDDELGVAVALKVIRPEVTADPYVAREVERRFKRELLLARQVTHKNVVRIHDLGEVDGIKYITMPFIEGRDLSSVLREAGTLPVPRVLRIAKQVAAGLQAAHEAGVVHRDLKPENVMIAEDDQALIMDFGISRSVQQSGGTMTAHGAVVGTLEYMAPEQGRGQQVDQRADVYAFGLMLYDMLAGRGRLQSAESAIAELMARMTQPPKPLRSIVPSIPEPLEAIVARCVEPDAEKRYQSAAELLADLEQLDAEGRAIPKVVPKPARRTANIVMAVVTLIAVVVAGVAWWRSGRLPGTPPAAREPVSIIIADFDNRAGDDAFTGLVEQALAIGVESTSFVSVFPRRDALRALRDVNRERLDFEAAQLVGKRQDIDYVVHGIIERAGNGFKLRVQTVPDVFTDEATASTREDVLTAVGNLAKDMRTRLGDSGARDAGAGETFTAGNIDAAAAYAKAQELNWSGQIPQAIVQYEKAIELDREFGRSYAGLAALYYNTGRRDDAVKMYETALRNSGRMTEREVLRTRGGYFLAKGDARQAMQAFEELLAKYAGDTAAMANLAVAKFQARDMKAAMEIGKRAAEVFPGNIIRRNNLALFAMYAGEFDLATEHANKALEINKEYPKALVAVAMSHLAQGRPKEAEQTWRRLEKIPPGRTLALAGLADLAMFRGLPADAIAILQGGAEADARQMVTLAEAQLMNGNTAAAASTASAAAARSKDPAVLYMAGRILLAAKRPQALQIADALSKQIDRDARIDGVLLLAESALLQGDYGRAQDTAIKAQDIADTWMGRYILGRVKLAADDFAGAEAQFDECLKKRGEATALFLDDIPTYRVVPQVYYYRGITREAMGNSRGADDLRAFLEMKDPAAADPLLADARKRLGQ